MLHQTENDDLFSKPKSVEEKIINDNERAEKLITEKNWRELAYYGEAYLRYLGKYDIFLKLRDEHFQIIAEEWEIKAEENKCFMKFLMKQLSYILKEVREKYKNKIYKDEKEKLFLKTFSQLEIPNYYKYDATNEGIFLTDKKDRNQCFLSTSYQSISISKKYIWDVFKKEFNFSYEEANGFFKKMMIEHLKIRKDYIVLCSSTLNWKRVLPIHQQLRYI